MNKLAGQCHERVRLMASEPDGHLLAQFRWTPQRGEFFFEQDRGMCESSTVSPLPPQRQDDERVGAVQTSPKDLLERDMENQDPRVQQSKRNNEEIICGETVYIAQLHRRALILDQTFREKVEDSLAQTITRGDTVVATGIEQHKEPTHGIDAFALDNTPHDQTRSDWMEIHTHTNADQMCGIPLPLDKSPDRRLGLATLPTHGMNPRKVPSGSNADSFNTCNSNVISVSFEQDGQSTQVEVQFAPIKKKARMHEKLSKYMPPNVRCQWPLSAYITDAVRCSIVCKGPTQMLQMVRWFLDSQVCDYVSKNRNVEAGIEKELIAMLHDVCLCDMIHSRVT